MRQTDPRHDSRAAEDLALVVDHAADINVVGDFFSGIRGSISVRIESRTVKFENVISLGVDGRVCFQISRYFEGMASTRDATISGAFGPHSAILKGEHFFDWTISWFSEVIRCLENRFDGVFERQLLHPLPEARNVVADGRYHFRFYHLFNSRESLSFDDMVADQYPYAYGQILGLRDKFLKHLSAENPTIYIRCQAHADEGQRFCEMMRVVYPLHRFHLVIVQMAEATHGFTLREENFSVYEMTSFIDKPAEDHWTGDDVEWTRLFNSIGPLADRGFVSSAVVTGRVPLVNPDTKNLSVHEISRICKKIIVSRLNAEKSYVRIPKIIVHYWDQELIPGDVVACIRTWDEMLSYGYKHFIFNDAKARSFVLSNFSDIYVTAFDYCHHPAMRADYFRLCYMFVNGGVYTDADNVLVDPKFCDAAISTGASLQLNPFFQDKSVDPWNMLSNELAIPKLSSDTDDLIFCYFNNNPIISQPRHPVVYRALQNSTGAILRSKERSEQPDIRETTGPALLTRALAECAFEKQIFSFSSINDWNSISPVVWNLDYRNTDRNWRSGRAVPSERVK